jgi:hypothetical protein
MMSHLNKLSWILWAVQQSPAFYACLWRIVNVRLVDAAVAVLVVMAVLVLLTGGGDSGHHKQLVNANQVPEALLLARSQLTPLADEHPELLPTLRASMALLVAGLPGAAAADDDGDGPAVAAGGGSRELGAAILHHLLPLLQAKLGVEAPPLAKLLRVLLTCHKGWFRAQRCQDPFAAALQLDQLMQPEGGGGCGASLCSLAQQSATPSGLARAAAGTTNGTTDPALLDAAAGAAAGGGAPAAANRGPQDEMVMEEDELGDFDEMAVLQVGVLSLEEC